MMTNPQCQSYAIIALRNLAHDGTIKTNDKNIYRTLDHELYCIFDRVGEETAEIEATKILEGR